MLADDSDLTQLLITIGNGNQNAYDKLFPLVYGKLKEIAHSQLNREYHEHTFSRTELVHEAYMKLVDQTRIDYNDRNHFYAIAARSMRQILVDYARKKKALKRGGDQRDLTLDESSINIEEHATQIIEIDTLLDELSELDERLGKVVELRFFAGLSIEDTAAMLDISTSTANRDWAKARGWLYQNMKNRD
jgi:RNA polymerase sigma factor (TIGR02999 family)